MLQKAASGKYWNKYGMSIKAKDMPRDAVLMGSVACTVNAKLRKEGTYSIILIKLFLAGDGKQLLNNLKTNWPVIPCLTWCVGYLLTFNTSILLSLIVLMFFKFVYLYGIWPIDPSDIFKYFPLSIWYLCPNLITSLSPFSSL